MNLNEVYAQVQIPSEYRRLQTGEEIAEGDLWFDSLDKKFKPLSIPEIHELPEVLMDDFIIRRKTEDFKATNHWPVEKFEHNTTGTVCPCQPVLEFVEGGVVVIHNRMDGE